MFHVLVRERGTFELQALLHDGDDHQHRKIGKGSYSWMEEALNYLGKLFRDEIHSFGYILFKAWEHDSIIQTLKTQYLVW